MVDRGGLENRCARERTVGSNPTLSATILLIGTRIVTLKTNRWVPIKRERLDKAKSWYARYGRFSLLLSWLPVIGDPLTLVAGVMREPFASFLVLVAAAKTARYVVVYLLHIGFFT